MNRSPVGRTSDIPLPRPLNFAALKFDRLNRNGTRSVTPSFGTVVASLLIVDFNVCAGFGGAVMRGGEAMSLSVKNRNVTASIDGRVRRSYGLGVPAIGDNGG